MRLKQERTFVKKSIYEQQKKLRKIKNINERLKLTEEEKEEIERRIKKENKVIRYFEKAIIIRDYMQQRIDMIESVSKPKQDFAEVEYEQFKQKYYTPDIFDVITINESQLDMSKLGITFNKTVNQDLEITAVLRYASPMRNNTMS